MLIDTAYGCHEDVDMWGIKWYFTNASTVAVQSCPGTETAGRNFAYKYYSCMVILIMSPFPIEQ